MAECRHGLDTLWCLFCKYPVLPPRATIEATFSAKFEGDCRGCNLPISKGQIIHRLSDDSYMHQGCE